MNPALFLLLLNASSTSATGTAAITFAPVTLTAAATVSASGSFSATLAPVVLTAAGSAAANGTLTATLAPLTLSAAAFAGSGLATGSFSQTLSPLVLAASSGARATGSLSVQLSPISLTATATTSPGTTLPGIGVATPNVRTFVEQPGGVGGSGASINTTIDALTVAYAMDPGDLVDFRYDRSAALDAGETIVAPWSINMSPEGAALGVTISTAATYGDALALAGQGLQFWLSVDPTMQASALFAGTGASVQVTVKITTSNMPARKYERSLLVAIRQR